MIGTAVKNQQHELLIDILTGFGPKHEGFANHHDDGSIWQVDEFGDPPLIWACMNGDREAVDILLEHGANMFEDVAASDGDSPLHRAVKMAHLETVRHLLKRARRKDRPKLNRLTNMAGEVPLHLAAKYGFDDIAELLLAESKPNKASSGNQVGGNGGGNGEDEDDLSLVRDGGGRTAAELAESQGHALCAAVLRNPARARAQAAAEAEVERQDANNRRFLQAAQMGHQDAVAALLEEGVDIRHRDQASGRQALHYSAANHHNALSKFLVARGADPISKDKEGRTPQHYDTSLQFYRERLVLDEEKSRKRGNKTPNPFY